MVQYILLLLLLAGVLVTASSKVVPSGRKPAEGFAVMELFTSQGCSSCPAADKLLQKLQRETKAAPVYLLTYHVDYWDHLGWKDPFSKAEFSARQRQYSRWFGLANVYTPQLIVNGAHELVGSNERALRAILATVLTENTPTQLRLEWDSADKSKLRVEYTITNPLPGAKLVLALIQPVAQTAVLRGENKGQMLRHTNIVRDIITVPLLENTKTDRATTSLPPAWEDQGQELIGFVQHLKTGKILAAAKLPAARKP